MRARSESDIEAVSDIIHDCWFHLDNIEHHEVDRTLEIPFERGEKTSPLLASFVSRPGRSGAMPAVLKIRDVESIRIRDTEQVGDYDFKRLIFDPDTRELSITTGIPLQFIVVVGRLDLEVLG